MQAELDLPWRKHVGRNLTGPSNTDRSVGGRPIVLNVENVKELRPEGNEKALTNGEILEYREIRVIHGRRPQDVSSKVSVGVHRYRERIRIEVIVGGAAPLRLDHVGIEERHAAHQVGLHDIRIAHAGGSWPDRGTADTGPNV